MLVAHQSELVQHQRMVDDDHIGRQVGLFIGTSLVVFSLGAVGLNSSRTLRIGALDPPERLMTSLNFRQHEILVIARQAGKVTVDGLADRFDVTPQTIRKDLNDLCDQRLLTRTHGGALFSSGVENVAYEARRHLAQARNSLIGQRAAQLIPNNSSLFVNIGTTTEEVARALARTKGSRHHQQPPCRRRS